MLGFSGMGVSAKDLPLISISVDNDNILKDGGEAIVTVSLSKKSNGNNAIVSLSYETNGTGSMNYDFEIEPAVYYRKFDNNETSFSFKIIGVYQEWGSSKVELKITLSGIENATPSGPTSLLVVIADGADVTPPVFQNPQANITIDALGIECGEIVNYTSPSATDNFSAYTGTLTGFSYLGELDYHTYYYSDGIASATDAMLAAANVGGHLVTITSQTENDFIDNLVGGIWIGLNDATNEGTFAWSNGEAVSYTNWNGAEPNDYSTGEDYTEMYTTGLWNDLPVGSTRRYVVEFEGALVTQTVGLPSGSLFPVGTTTNTFLATDNAGNTATHSFTVTVADVTPPKISALLADYYDGLNFDTFQETIAVDELNYYWGSGAPESTLVGSDYFSIRFQGSVQAVDAGTYTFYTTSDDGVRLWVAGSQVVNNWTDHGTTVNSGAISLLAGQVVPIILEYYERTGGAVIKLEMSGPGLARQFVKSDGSGACQDVTVDVSATGSYDLTVDEVDPSYSDECGIASRTLSKTNFTCNDSGDNAVTFTVTDVNGNSTFCDINVKVVGTPDNSLTVTDDTQCEGVDASVTILASETDVVYSLFNGTTQIGSSVTGGVSTLVLTIPSSVLSVGDNTITVHAAKGACELDLLNKAVIHIDPIPLPIGIYFE
ncbi:hypothetical protein ALGA_2354 [Labilibaculum antarcticum]|uniref:PA14 domain-containing protein n=2 Tax=Labilibaculum antarcticum TaxID=1717717 RepID=A0A1Y1CN43_9BACT|nr:hypothetical protein ALGA_2354 [Labilibaculum antarcticum]